MHKWQLLLAATLLACAATARAAPCPGTAGWVFSDVDDSDPFCTYATWMAEQGITTGCEVIDDGHRNFCPTSPATRLQMAALLKRFADVTAPVKAYGSFSNNTGFTFIADSTGTSIAWPTTSLANGLALTGDEQGVIIGVAGDYRIHYCVRTFGTSGPATPALRINGIVLNVSTLPAIDGAGAGCLDIGASLVPGDIVQLVVQATLTVVSLQSPAGAELLIERIGP